MVAAHADARVLIIGQAPGRRVHASGVPWDDASGERLRHWLDVDAETFYDPARFALVPMGFCYPGTGARGDLPPRPECAPTWHAPLIHELRDVRLMLLLGRHAQKAYLDAPASASLTALVRAWGEAPDERVPLPHPSPRNNLWLVRNPWFELELLPTLRRRVARALADD